MFFFGRNKNPQQLSTTAVWRRKRLYTFNRFGGYDFAPLSLGEFPKSAAAGLKTQLLLAFNPGFLKSGELNFSMKILQVSRKEEQLWNCYDRFGFVFDMTTPTYTVYILFCCQKLLLEQGDACATSWRCRKKSSAKEFSRCAGVLAVCGHFWCVKTTSFLVIDCWWLLYEKGHLLMSSPIFGDRICSPLDSNTGRFHHAIELSHWSATVWMVWLIWQVVRRDNKRGYCKCREAGRFLLALLRENAFPTWRTVKIIKFVYNS